MMDKDELLNFELDNEQEVQPTGIGTIIKVIGVGGGGSNAVNNMFAEDIKGVDFVIANTDVQALKRSDVPVKIQLGETLTEGLGAGNNPDSGENAAKESIDEIKAVLDNSTKMVFITAGMGGGTGTGAAPVIAKIAKEMGILTIGIVTIPFRFEGNKRIIQAVEGLKKMRENVDALLIIDNEKITEIFADYTLTKAFKLADNVLTTAAKSIADIITSEGLVNVDFADVRSVMLNSGVAVMGTGVGEGNDRGITAVRKALESPLLNNNDIKGAKNLLVNIYTPEEEADEITTEEINQITNFLQRKSRYEANMIWGVSHDPELKGKKCVVTVIATAFEDNILPEAETLMDNIANNTNSPDKKEDVETVDNKEQEEPVLSMEQLRQQIASEPLNPIDYSSDSIVDDFYKNPAYDRNGYQPDSVSQPNIHQQNSFLGPHVD